MEEKVKSIWDEVDLPKEEAADKPDPEQSENTTDGLFKVKTFENAEKGEKYDKEPAEYESSPEFKLSIEKEDNAEKKGLLSLLIIALCAVVLCASIAGIFVTIVHRNRELKNSQAEMERLRNLKDITPSDPSLSGGAETVLEGSAEGNSPVKKESEKAEILDKYKALYEENPDIIGWLSIDGTVIDYPVMQTPDDEEYYLNRGFDKQYSDNGCLIMDTDSNVGVGTKEGDYLGGSDRPSDNLIIHGHTMKNGEMFGNLSLYEKEDYAKEHNIIKFDSLYESREYEVIAVFYSQVYYTTDDCFKYYKFFSADNQEEFDDWYDNIKDLSLFDTGVEAKFGDEFITLSVCAYHVENGRLVVVGKRIK